MKISFKTLGCKLNQYETQLLREMAEDSPFATASFVNGADIYVINMCSVTMNAVQQSRNIIRRARRMSQNARIIVTGCYPVEMENLPEVDTFVPNTQKHSFFQRLFNSQKTCISTFNNHTRAFVKIQTGCNKFCSYCIVPYLRKNEHSRPHDEIRKEITSLIRNRFKEITLTGVHIGRYNDNGRDLVQLLKEIEHIPNLEKIRLSSLNPEEITNELIDTVVSSSKICHHFHLSLQSGDRNVLDSMGRNYEPAYSAGLITRIKNQMSDCGIGADVIIGFPSETAQRFQNTYNFIRNLPFTYLHVFRYSPRKGTLAAILPNTVHEKEKKERSAMLRELALLKSIDFRNHYRNKVLTVLVEAKRDKLTNMMVAFSGNYIRVLIPPVRNCGGEFRRVRIEKIDGYDTYGLLCSD